MKPLCTTAFIGLIAALAIDPALAEQNTFNIVNGSRGKIVAVQMRVMGSKKWTSVSQREPLAFRHGLAVTQMARSCANYDVQVLFDDGHRAVTLAKRLCPQDTLTITD